MRMPCRPLAAALAMAALPGWAACTLSVQGVAFGSYDVFSYQSVDSTGNISVTCDVATAYSISISPGTGSYATRSMANGPHRLNYNLFTDATRTTVWGDGTSGSGVVAGNGTMANHTVFGRIPARQNLHIGAYSDNLTVTLTF